MATVFTDGWEDIWLDYIIPTLDIVTLDMLRRTCDYLSKIVNELLLKYIVQTNALRAEKERVGDWYPVLRKPEIPLRCSVGDLFYYTPLMLSRRLDFPYQLLQAGSGEILSMYGPLIIKLCFELIDGETTREILMKVSEKFPKNRQGDAGFYKYICALQKIGMLEFNPLFSNDRPDVFDGTAPPELHSMTMRRVFIMYMTRRSEYIRIHEVGRDPVTKHTDITNTASLKELACILVRSGDPELETLSRYIPEDIFRRFRYGYHFFSAAIRSNDLLWMWYCGAYPLNAHDNANHMRLGIYLDMAACALLASEDGSDMIWSRCAQHEWIKEAFVNESFAALLTMVPNWHARRCCRRYIGDQDGPIPGPLTADRILEFIFTLDCHVRREVNFNPLSADALLVIFNAFCRRPTLGARCTPPRCACMDCALRALITKMTSEPGALEQWLMEMNHKVDERMVPDSMDE